MAVPANRALQLAQIEHAANVRGYSAQVVRRLIAVLNRADAELFAELVRKLEYMDPQRFTVKRLDELLQSVGRLNRDSYALFDRELRKEIQDFTAYEVAFQKGMLERHIPVEVTARFPVFSVNIDQVYAAALSRPFQGALLREWIADQESYKAKLIRRAVADGFAQGRTTQQIVQAIRGTRALGYADGIIEITRRNATAVVRTALSHTAAFAQEQVYERNADLIRGYVWVSTLDNRTTPECQVRDGLEYSRDFKPIGHDVPWGAGPGKLHWQCRSTRSPITKSWRELGVPIDEFTPSTRASMDGQVPAKMKYEDWLRTLSPARQDQILGKANGERFRADKLSLRELYAATNPMTLQQMKLLEDRGPSLPTMPVEGPTKAYTGTMSPNPGDAFHEVEPGRLRATSEKAFVIDANGYAREIGTPVGIRSVKFSEVEDRAMAGAILTHNHPAGISFSEADISTAINNKLREMRAVGTDPVDKDVVHIFRAWPNDAGWPNYPDWYRTWAKVEYELGNKIAKEVQAGRISQTQANVRFFHELNEEVAKRTGYNYRKVDLQ